MIPHSGLLVFFCRRLLTVARALFNPFMVLYGGPDPKKGKTKNITQLTITSGMSGFWVSISSLDPVTLMTLH